MPATPTVTIHRSIPKALKLFDADRLRWLDEAAALGPLVAMRMGAVKVWVLTDPEVARRMLVTDGASWTRPPAILAPVRAAIGDNLFSQSDKSWARLQPLVAPAFRKRALEARLADIDHIVAEFVRTIPLATTVDLELVLGQLALVLAAWVLLGDRLDVDRAEAIANHQRDVVGWVGRRLGQFTGFVPVAVGAPARRMKQQRALLYDYADEVIARARAGDTDHDDVLGALMAARPKGRPLDPEELRSQVLGLFLAGNETTAAALSWALVYGAAAPGEWERLRADPAARVRPFVTESLRLSPPVWGLPRTATKPRTMLSAGAVTVRVRRGVLVNVYLRGINRDASTWPDPLRFDPDRHEHHDVSEHRALIPFGLGARGCIGQHLALAELHAVVPALARHGNIEIEGTPVENPALALRVHGGLRGRFTAPNSGGGR